MNSSMNISVLLCLEIVAIVKEWKLGDLKVQQVRKHWLQPKWNVISENNHWITAYGVFKITTRFALNTRVINSKGKFWALNVKTKCNVFGNSRNENRLEKRKFLINFISNWICLQYFYFVVNHQCVFSLVIKHYLLRH